VEQVVKCLQTLSDVAATRRLVAVGQPPESDTVVHECVSLLVGVLLSHADMHLAWVY